MDFVTDLEFISQLKNDDGCFAVALGKVDGIDVGEIIGFSVEGIELMVVSAGRGAIVVVSGL